MQLLLKDIVGWKGDLECMKKQEKFETLPKSRPHYQGTLYNTTGSILLLCDAPISIRKDSYLVTIVIKTT